MNEQDLKDAKKDFLDKIAEEISEVHSIQRGEENACAYAMYESAHATLRLAQATLLAAEPQVCVGGEWSPPIVGVREVAPDNGCAARVRELLGVLDNRTASSGMTTGDLKNFAELKRLVLDMLGNPLYWAVEIETAGRAAEIAEVLRDWAHVIARNEHDKGLATAASRNPQVRKQAKERISEAELYADFLDRIVSYFQKKVGEEQPE